MDIIETDLGTFGRNEVTDLSRCGIWTISYSVNYLDGCQGPSGVLYKNPTTLHFDTFCRPIDFHIFYLSIKYAK